ncbi:MAG: YbhB/YbcL family Raf kinase inhibitor-like protein [Candidatus Omnitrophica bacterium]|nr:YbhB/YbcL family Raf kinase inhibitor-like protein [Candidatus Omnitrophota bacterium]
MAGKVKWFINDFLTRHTSNVDRVLHIIGIPQAFFGIFQLLTGKWIWGFLNLFLGYLWQWIGHKYFDKNEVGEVILIKKIIKKIFPLILTVFLLLAGGDAMALRIKSPAFNDGDMIPDKYTAKGRDISPPLFWEDVPDGTASFAIICEDPDAPGGRWVHWVIYNIRKGISRLSEGIPQYDEVENGAKQGMNDFRRVGYGGPAAPPGPAHRYFFKMYALDKVLEVESGLTRDQLLKAMKGHIIQEAEVMGKFKR